MARLVAITGPMDEAKMADLVAMMDPILKEQVADHQKCNRALANDVIAAEARIRELDKLVDKLYCRVFILEVTKRKLVVQLSANAELGGAAREE